jgi:hypothetical protein
MPSIFETVQHMRLQVSTISPSDDTSKGYASNKPMCDTARLANHGSQLCTVVLSTRPENSTSAQLFMGLEAPAETPPLEVTRQAVNPLSIAVYRVESRIAHAVIPLDQVWEVRPFLHEPVAVHSHIPVSKEVATQYQRFVSAIQQSFLIHKS